VEFTAFAGEMLPEGTLTLNNLYNALRLMHCNWTSQIRWSI